jgi:hypothetical protein
MNKKDLIVTTISQNYNWVDIKNSIKSLKNTSYIGDILILAYNFPEEHDYFTKLKELGVMILTPKNTYRAEHEEDFVWHSGQVNSLNAHKLIHNVRLFHLWQYFTETQTDLNYNRIIFTDGRDIVFQSNPSEWLDKHMVKDILVPSEGILYKNEPWNTNNALTNYGPYIYEYILKESEACNVGTFVCSASICKDLCLTLYLMSNNIGHADQPSFNILTKTLLKDKCQWVDYNDAWALQIGTIVNDLDNYVKFEDGVISSIKTNQPYCLVHQYDRVPQYKNYFDSNI